MARQLFPYKEQTELRPIVTNTRSEHSQNPSLPSIKFKSMADMVLNQQSSPQLFPTQTQPNSFNFMSSLPTHNRNTTSLHLQLPKIRNHPKYNYTPILHTTFPSPTQQPRLLFNRPSNRSIPFAPIHIKNQTVRQLTKLYNFNPQTSTH